MGPAHHKGNIWVENNAIRARKKLLSFGVKPGGQLHFTSIGPGIAIAVSVGGISRLNGRKMPSAALVASARLCPTVFGSKTLCLP